MRVEVDRAVDIACFAAQFAWTWTVGDLEPWCSRFGWQVSHRTDKSIGLTTNLGIDYPEAGFHVGRDRIRMDWLTVGVTDTAQDETAAGMVVDAFAEIADRIAAELGPPGLMRPGRTSKISWYRPDAVITLVDHDHLLIELRIGSPALEEWFKTPVEEARWFF